MLPILLAFSLILTSPSTVLSFEIENGGENLTPQLGGQFDSTVAEDSRGPQRRILSLRPSSMEDDKIPLLSAQAIDPVENPEDSDEEKGGLTRDTRSLELTNLLRMGVRTARTGVRFAVRTTRTGVRIATRTARTGARLANRAVVTARKRINQFRQTSNIREHRRLIAKQKNLIQEGVNS